MSLTVPFEFYVAYATFGPSLPGSQPGSFLLPSTATYAYALIQPLHFRMELGATSRKGVFHQPRTAYCVHALTLVRVHASTHSARISRTETELNVGITLFLARDGGVCENTFFHSC
jgi:hypothetical protein